MINAIRAAPRGRVRYLDLKVLAAIFAAHGFRTASAAEVAAPLNYFLHAAGPAATPTLRLGWIFAAICVAVCLIIAVLLTVAILRRRPMPLPRRPWRVGSDRRRIELDLRGRWRIHGRIGRNARLRIDDARKCRPAERCAFADHHRHRVRLVVEDRLRRFRRSGPTLCHGERDAHSRR